MVPEAGSLVIFFQQDQLAEVIGKMIGTIDYKVEPVSMGFFLEIFFIYCLVSLKPIFNRKLFELVG